MRLTFLGTGTSFGVPQIGCGCAVCRSTDPRDKRSRSGALIEAGGSTILIDTPPELRLQLIAGGFSQVDAVLYTHEHADHTNGIDDLRMFSVRQRRALPIYGPPETLERLRASFSYIFDDVRPYEGTSKPSLTLHAVEPGVAVDVAGMAVLRSGAGCRGSMCWSSTRSGGGRTPPTSASARRSRPPSHSAPGAPISLI
jgi:phosphoribosyl 1,2-cyclic phosphate phosphodiesterase